MAVDRIKVQAARDAITRYRDAHAALHNRRWTRDVPDSHTPLLEALMADLKALKLDRIDDAFNLSRTLDREDRKKSAEEWR